MWYVQTYMTYISVDEQEGFIDLLQKNTQVRHHCIYGVAYQRSFDVLLGLCIGLGSYVAGSVMLCGGVVRCGAVQTQLGDSPVLLNSMEVCKYSLVSRSMGTKAVYLLRMLQALLV